MSRRGASPARGFSLLEVGVVLGVASVLLTAVAVLGAGQIKNAKNERIGIELQSFAQIGASAHLRGVQRNLGIATFDAAAWNLGPNQSVCFDIAGNQPNNNCAPAATAKMGGQRFSASPVLTQLLTDTPPNGGYNPYCVSYEICLFENRAEARTCVPESARELSGRPCNPQRACPNPRIDGEQAFCVSAAVTPAFWKRNEAAYSIQPTWFDTSINF
ncbi:MAG TPA: hypothetical protein DFS52_17930 [Myxococcales bacterium]|jgi:type II secretory pathway pseudopilin PulG|nr:hypothetical protein [Myxococcales bacterium]